MRYDLQCKEVCLSDQVNLKYEDESYAAETLEFKNPIISPDGTKIAFEVINSYGDLAHGPLCIADADGKNQQILSGDGVFQENKPKWIGNRLVYMNVGLTDGNSALRITDAKSNVPSNLLEDVMSFDMKQPAK